MVLISCGGKCGPDADPYGPCPQDSGRFSFIPLLDWGSKMNALIGLADVIGYVETKNNPFGYRFEPLLYQKLSAPSKAAQDILATIQHIHQCSLNSAKAIFSSSYGSTQILAENLYDPAVGLKVPVWAYMNDAILQAATFSDFVKWKQLDYRATDLLQPTLREHFAIMYNGSPAYAELIAQSLDHFGVK
jgi:hypothetical protein